MCYFIFSWLTFDVCVKILVASGSYSVKCADQNRGHHQFITNAGIISNPQINRQRHMKEDGGFVEIIERLCQRS